MSVSKTNPILSVKDVSFAFGKTKVLDDISFSLEEGDFLGVIGPNGSGKTTLIKIILGLLPLQSGSISLLGQDITAFSRWADVGYVRQKAANIEESFPATVFEVVSMGVFAGKSFPKFLTAKDTEKIHTALAIVGMDKFAGKRIGELSGGQQQRILIANAIVSDPKILFLDEPTTGVDSLNQDTFYELLKKLNERGITIILISHDISRITSHVTKIASLNQTLEFYGTHEAFCAYDKQHASIHGEPKEHKLCIDHLQ